MVSTIARSTASGSTDSFSVPFPYLDKTHVQVRLNGVLKTYLTDYTFTTDSIVKLTAGNPAAGVVVERKRVTPTDPLTDFSPGNLDTGDLNVGILQPLYVAQEGNDSAADILLRAWFTTSFGNGGTITVGPDGTILIWDASGNVVVGPSATDIEGFSAAAAASAAAATAAQSAAAGSATSASGSASTASTQATNAAASAVAAAASVASVNLPAITANTMLVANPTATGYLAKTRQQTLDFLTATAADISFLQTGTGAVARTSDAEIRDKAISAFDFMTAAQVADVKARTKTLDVSAAMAAWYTACVAQKKAGYAPSGTYRFDSQYLMDCAGNATGGITLIGDGVQNTLFDASNVATIPPFKLFCTGGTTANPIIQAYAKILGIGFAGNVNGAIFQVGQSDKSDQINLMRLEIWLANNNTGSSVTLAEVNNGYGCSIDLNGSTASTSRTILTLGAITGGAGYVNGTYSNVPLTGGNGGFATANITVSGGAVTAVTLVNGGYGYNATEALSASNTKLGGSGSGFSIPVSTVRITSSCGIRLKQCSFSKFFVSISGVQRAVHLTDGFSVGNVFISPDLEIVDYGTVIDSANAVANTFIGGTWAYYSFGANATAGEDNVFINPNVNSPYPFLSSANTGIYEFDPRAMTVRGTATFKGAALATGVGGVGYGTGAGGTVTQATSKSTGVTLNKTCGQITMNASALTAATIASFVLTDSAIAATDVLILNHVSGGTPGAYSLNARCAAGSATIDVRNNTAGSLSEAIVIAFAVIKAVTA